MTEQKLNLNINSAQIRYLEVPDIIDYKLVHAVFAVADRKTRHVKIP